MQFDAKDIEQNKLLAAIGYVGILCLIPLLAKKDSRFCQEHGKQGFVLFVCAIAVTVIGWIPFIGWIAWFVGMTFIGICSLIGLINALQGKFWEVPLLGQYRKMVNF